MSSLNITAGGPYTVNESDLTITIATTEAVTLTGDVNNELTEVVITTTADNANLTIENLNITNASTAIITVGDGTENTLNITGENVFEVAAPSGACVNVGGGLTINGTGSFKGTSIIGAVIGINGDQQKPDSNITIESGTFDLTCRSGACAIGGAGARGNSIGNITITGTADITASAPSGHAATIGASYWGSCGDILISGDAKITATSGQHSAAIGSAVYCENGSITIGGRASVVANTTSTDVKDAAIGGTYGEQVASIGDIKIIEDATVIASSAHGLALDNILYVEGETYLDDYYTVNADSAISISGDTTTSAQSNVILTNGNTSDSVIIGKRAYQGGKMIFRDGNLVMTGNWTSLESGGWGYSSIVQMDYTQNIRDDKFANFTLSGGDLKDEDGDGAPDGVAIGSIIYVQKSGAHTNVRNLSGNVIYNGDALGVEGDDSYNIEAVSPIDLSEEFPLSGYYITDPHVTAMRLISDGATISPRGDSGSGTVPADWYSFDNAGGTVTFRDGSYCLYPERQFFSRSYTKVDISNNNQGVEITAGDDLIQTIGNLTDGYAITIESGIAVGEKINFETSGNGVIVVKTTANTGKYSLAADSDEWQYQNYTINGGGKIQFSDGDHVIFTDTYFPTRNFTTVNADNGGDGFSLNVEEDKFSAISGLNNGYAISVNAGGNISDSLAIHTDGGAGTIAAGNTTLIADGDDDFAIKIGSTSSIEGLKNFSGAATLLGNETFDSDIALALQRENFSLDTDENYSAATLTNATGDSLNVYYLNATVGGVVDLSNETLTNAALLAQGAEATLIGSQGDDQLIGDAAIIYQTGNAGQDTFRGGTNLESVLITDYKEGEDVVYHGRPFADLSINGSIEGNDYTFYVGNKTITVQDSADKVIEVVNVEGETRLFGKYLTLDDNDPATVTAQDGVATIDAALRTEDIVINGNSGDNTIIGRAGKATVENFNANFDDGDKVSIGATNYNFSYDGEKVNVKSGAGKAVLQNILSEDGVARVLAVIDGKETKTAIAQNGSIIATGDDLADAYYGKKSGVDFSGYSETLNLDLSENFYGINQVTVGSGLNTLSSSSANETLTGNSDGITEYFFGAGGGRDVIQNFNFDEDKINVSDAVTGVRIIGEGDASLWGGNSGNDLLVGSAGKNTFFYTSGNDTISGTNDGDEIILSGVTLEQISGTSITADGVAINFTDGGSLQVNGAADATYQLADGAKFSANHESLSWESK